MEPVDFYCERIGPGFGAEPLNTASAAAFLLVGLIAFALAPAADDRRAAAALAAVGLASMLMHGFALGVLAQVDLWVNRLYLALLAALMLRRLGGTGLAAALAGGVAAAAALELLPGLTAVRATLGIAADPYTLLVLVFALSAAAIGRAAPASARGLALAALILAAGLPFRFLDGALCASWPSGTHWLWHLSNAVASAVVLATLARHRPAAIRLEA